VIRDPLCGCGTSIIAAERLKRRCLGIDLKHFAIGRVKRRLKERLGNQLSPCVARAKGVTIITTLRLELK
jgi:site-specific DNA-methyltransferase (adenine-specific)